MRTIIYGAGGIGCIVGGYLALAKHDVLLIERTTHAQAINEHGLKLVTPNKTYTIPVKAVNRPDQVDFNPDDVVFLSVKGQNTEEAIKDLAALKVDVPVFCFQNGVRNEEIVARYFPRVYGVMVRISASHTFDGEVISRRDPPGWLVMGRYPSGKDALLEEVAVMLRSADFNILVSPDVMPYKWGKLIDNLANAVAAITNAKRTDMDNIIRLARQEAQDIMKQASVRWIPTEEINRELPDAVKPLRGNITTEALNSTWQSLALKTGDVETEYLNGEIVRLAKKLGKRSPVNEKLLQICEEMAARRETPGKYTPEELLKILGES